MFKRIFTVVIDSVGCGEEPRSPEFGDYGVNTIKHISEYMAVHKLPFALPNMEKLGYGNLTQIKGVNPNPKAIGSYGKMNEVSNGKDTMTGHWEIMGLNIQNPFLTFTDNGFPKELIDELEAKTGHKVIGNKSASGTEILVELGEEQMRDGSMIVYTSADSVLQIAAHEEKFGLEELYRCCHIAREITLKPEWMVGRVIARPFVGPDKDHFERTPNRHDYALSPFDKTVLDYLKEDGKRVIGVGKISDIYNGSGISDSHRNLSNKHGMEQFIDFLKEDFTGLCYLNLVDFDAKYGHRRDPKGYADSLMEFDGQLGTFISNMTDDDLLIITADHGNDPTYKGSDHTREYVPLLVYSRNGKSVDLGIRKSFADLGATVADNFGVKIPDLGTSFLKDIE